MNEAFEPGYAEWEGRALRELYAEYAHIVRSRRLKMRPAALDLSDSAAYWGLWNRSTRTILMSRKLLREHSWFHVLAVLRHEMAHQLVDEDSNFAPKAHGGEFKKACEKLGLPAEFSGAAINLQNHTLDWRQSPRDAVSEKMLEKVRKLLNLATSANEHEALLAMNRVREIYARYNLENSLETAGRPEFFHLALSTGRKRLLTYEQKIVGILVAHFFVQVIVGRTYDVQSGEHHRLIEIIGTRENVLMAEYVYVFLIQQSEHLVVRVGKDSGIKFSGQAKKSFRMGILEGFDEKLRRPPLKNTASVEHNISEDIISKALEVFQKDRQLEKYISTVYPRLSSLYSQARQVDHSAFDAGKRVGRQMTLNKPITSAGVKARYLLSTAKN